MSQLYYFHVQDAAVRTEKKQLNRKEIESVKEINRVISNPES